MLRQERILGSYFLMDLSKAFDTINHKTLKLHDKLHACGFSFESLEII